jgi:hypothetical protein
MRAWAQRTQKKEFKEFEECRSSSREAEAFFTTKRLKTTARGFSPGLTALPGRPHVVFLTAAGPKTCSDVTRQPGGTVFGPIFWTYCFQITKFC